MIHNVSINPDWSVSNFVRRTYFLKMSGVSSPRGFVYNVTENGSEGKLKNLKFTQHQFGLAPHSLLLQILRLGLLKHNYQ